MVNDYKGMNQLMVDIETLGTKPGSVILSIGAVMFDMVTGEVGKQLFIPIEMESCEKVGLTIMSETFLWWLKQSDKTRNSLLNVKFKVALPEALHRLGLMISEYTPDGIWGNSNRFDLGLLEAAYSACRMKTPWPYWAERDVRTLVSFAPHIKDECINTLPHDPISDCLYQIEYCSKIYNSLTQTKPALVTGTH